MIDDRLLYLFVALGEAPVDFLEIEFWFFMDGDFLWGAGLILVTAMLCGLVEICLSTCFPSRENRWKCRYELTVAPMGDTFEECGVEFLP